MANEKDNEQDELIRRNTEHIARNEEAIRRQTEALEKIRDHYFPHQSLLKKIVTFSLKVVGVIALYAGLRDSLSWYFNARKVESMANRSAVVARRLFFHENDAAGAVRFFEKAAELDDNEPKHRIALTYVKGIAAIGEFFDLGRPFTPEERKRVDAILAEAAFLQEASPDDPMPYLLAAQAQMLRGEKDASNKSLATALRLADDQPMIRVSACALRFVEKDFAGARAFIEEAERLAPQLPFVHYWKTILALAADRDLSAARAHVDELLRLAPNLAIAHLAAGRVAMLGEKPDLKAARASFARTLQAAPDMTQAALWTAETYEREGNLTLARLWLDRIIAQDPTFMRAIETRARVCEEDGDDRAAIADWTVAIELAPFRADLYRKRAKRLDASNETARAAEDRKKADAIEKGMDK